MIRDKAAVLGILAVSLLTVFGLLLDIVAVKLPSDALSISDYERRFAEVRKSLPANAVAGYVMDGNPQDTSALAEFNVVQYAIAPTILANNMDQKLVLGNFHNPSSPVANPNL